LAAFDSVLLVRIYCQAIPTRRFPPTVINSRGITWKVTAGHPLEGAP